MEKRVSEGSVNVKSLKNGLLELLALYGHPHLSDFESKGDAYLPSADIGIHCLQEVIEFMRSILQMNYPVFFCDTVVNIDVDSTCSNIACGMTGFCLKSQPRPLKMKGVAL